MSDRDERKPKPTWRDREPPAIAGRTPPHDLDAEGTVLSACLLDGEGLAKALELLKPEYFYSEANAQIFRGCVDLGAASKPVDVVSVATWLRDREVIQKIGGAEYLARLTDATPAVFNVEHHCATVKEKWRLRRAIATCQHYAANGYGDVGDPDEFLGELERDLLGVVQAGVKRQLVPLKELTHRAYQRIAHPERDNDRPRFETGLAAWDEVVGTLRGGHLVIVAARPGMGKSALKSEIGMLLAARHGYVASFELELDEDEVTDRAIAQRSWVALDHIENPELLTKAEHRRVVAAGEELHRLHLFVDDTPGLTLRELQSKARAIAAAAARERTRRVAAGEDLAGMASPNGMGAVLVDYLQLMKYDGATKANTRDEAIGYITRGLKELAKELRCPVIALSQLNRGVERSADKRPTLADLRESGSIEADADKVIFVYRDSYYNREADKRVAELIAAKNRSGKTGTVEIGWAPWCVKFHDRELNVTEGVAAEESIPPLWPTSEAEATPA